MHFKDPLEEDMATTPVFLPGKSHGQRNLVSYRPQGCKESNVTEATEQAHMHRHSIFKRLSLVSETILPIWTIDVLFNFIDSKYGQFAY